jgi:hypothetical protein
MQGGREVAGGERGEDGRSEGRQVAPIASPSPVGSAKFGARVGGLVSPTLVGTRVGAAHAHTRTVRVRYCEQTAAAVLADGCASVHAVLGPGVPVEYPASSASQVPLRAMPLTHARVHAVVPHTCAALRAVGPRPGGGAHRTV